MDSKLLIIPCDLREVPGTSQQAPGAGNRASVPISQILKLRQQASMCFVKGHMEELVPSAQTRDYTWVFCFQHTHGPCARRHPAWSKPCLLHLDHLALAVCLLSVLNANTFRGMEGSRKGSYAGFFLPLLESPLSTVTGSSPVCSAIQANRKQLPSGDGWGPSSILPWTRTDPGPSTAGWGLGLDIMQEGGPPTCLGADLPEPTPPSVTPSNPFLKPINKQPFGLDRYTACPSKTCSKTLLQDVTALNGQLFDRRQHEWMLCRKKECRYGKIKPLCLLKFPSLLHYEERHLNNDFFF